MRAYFDSSALLKLYVHEPGSEEAGRLAQDSELLILSSLQILEIKTALRSAVGRRWLRTGKVNKVLKVLDADIQSGVFEMIYPDWEVVYSLSNELSEKYTSRMMCRSLDILHVAVSIIEGTEVFVSADQRQIGLAQKVGLMVEDILSSP